MLEAERMAGIFFEGLSLLCWEKKKVVQCKIILLAFFVHCILSYHRDNVRDVG